jgi:DNA polymerase III sliding clamp (beta) subunit (PCNA family)
MERKLLESKLELCAPALSNISVIPVLAHYAFTGTQLMTYNDNIAIVTNLKTEFKGTLPGLTLLNLIRLSRAKDVEFVVDGTDVVIKAASTRMKLPSEPIKEFLDIFTPPEIKEGALLHVNVAEFTRCIGQLMRSVSEDTSIPDQLGVTMIAYEKTVELYSTNHATLSRAIVKLTKPTKAPRAILSKQFCEQMLVIAKDANTLQLEIVDDHSLLVAGNTLLIGKLVNSEKPMDFRETILDHFPTVKTLAPIPSKLRGIIERALVVAESKNDSSKTLVTVKEGRARFVTKSDGRGEVTDSMQVTDAQPPTQVTLEAKHIKKGLDSFDNMILTSRGCVMAKDNVTYMIATQG